MKREPQNTFKAHACNGFMFKQVADSMKAYIVEHGSSVTQAMKV
jgi:hypothetical protein